MNCKLISEVKSWFCDRMVNRSNFVVSIVFDFKSGVRRVDNLDSNSYEVTFSIGKFEFSSELMSFFGNETKLLIVTIFEFHFEFGM